MKSLGIILFWIVIAVWVLNLENPFSKTLNVYTYSCKKYEKGIFECDEGFNYYVREYLPLIEQQRVVEHFVTTSTLGNCSVLDKETWSCSNDYRTISMNKGAYFDSGSSELNKDKSKDIIIYSAQTGRISYFLSYIRNFF